MNKKKQSAFEQSLHKITTDSQSLFEQSQQASLPVLHDIFMQALQTFQNSQKAKITMPQDRAKKGSFNISNLKGGQVLKSDGSVDQPEQTDDNSFQANTGNESPLSMLMAHLAPTNTAVQPDVNAFSQGPTTPTQTMTQDLLSTLQTTQASPIGASESYPIAEGEEGQPTEFYAGLQSKTGTGVIDRIKDFLDKRLVTSQNQFSQPAEGQPSGRLQLGLRTSYGSMFNQAPPETTTQPRNQVWQNLFKDLETEDTFNG